MVNKRKTAYLLLCIGYLSISMAQFGSIFQKGVTVSQCQGFRTNHLNTLKKKCKVSSMKILPCIHCKGSVNKYLKKKHQSTITLMPLILCQSSLWHKPAMTHHSLCHNNSARMNEEKETEQSRSVIGKCTIHNIYNKLHKPLMSLTSI